MATCLNGSSPQKHHYASMQTLSCLQRGGQNSVTFPFHWPGSATAKHTWGKYLSAHWQEECEKCPKLCVCMWVRVLRVFFFFSYEIERLHFCLCFCSVVIIIYHFILAFWYKHTLCSESFTLNVDALKHFLTTLQRNQVLCKGGWFKTQSCQITTVWFLSKALNPQLLRQ